MDIFSKYDGNFVDNKSRFMFKKIIYKNSKDVEYFWQIIIKLKNNKPIHLYKNSIVELLIHSGKVGSIIRKSIPTYITKGKNIGKINEISPLIYAFNTAQKLYNTKLKKIKENTLLYPPMLLKNIKDLTNPPTDISNYTLQRKYDGIHLVTFIKNNICYKYTRSGLLFPIDKLKYITNDIKLLYKLVPDLTSSEIQKKYGIPTEYSYCYSNTVPYFDGELFKEGLPLNIISGIVRQLKDSSSQLIDFYIFDVFFPEAIKKGHNMISEYRQLYLNDLFKKIDILNNNKIIITHLKQVENFKRNTLKEVIQLMNLFVKNNYEGIILRKDDSEYIYSINNYHSTNIIKIKPIYDDEFPIIDFTEGKGKDKGAIIWICSTTSNTTFNVVPNLSYKERYNLYYKLITSKTLFEKKYKNKLLTVQHVGLSHNNIPLQPKGKTIRDYE